MPLDFTATESGFDNGMGGASNAAGADDLHYVLFGKDGDGVYFEYDDQIHDSILDDNERQDARPSRYAAGAALVAGFLAFLGLGFVVGSLTNFASAAMPAMFSPNLKPEFIFYPPIMAMFVDLMHSFASRFESK